MASCSITFSLHIFMKPKIYFIPHYIAPLKHVERMFPYFGDIYDFGFLIIGENDGRRRIMVEYCKNKGYEFYVIDRWFQIQGRGLTHDGKIHIPFITPLVERYRYSKECQTFLKKVRPSKVIAIKSELYHHNMVMKEANRFGIETLLLFWAGPLQQIAYRDHGANTRVERKSFVEHIKRAVRKVYSALINVECRIADILDFSSRESRYSRTYAMPKKIGIFDIYEYTTGRLIPYNPQTVHVVGSPDFEIVDSLKKKVGNDPSFKELLLKKYGLSEQRPKIFVVPYRFYALPTLEEHKMSIAEQVAHYYEVFKTIRVVFSENEADVILKMHPSEAMIYESYKGLGVKIYHNESQTDELLCLSDLYIGDPASSVNNMVLASGIQAIFINFSKLQFLNSLMEYFHIKNIVMSKEEFIKKLFQFKQGELERQYDNAIIDRKSVAKTVKLIAM